MGAARLVGVVLPHTSLSFQKASSAVTEGYTEGTCWFSRDLAPGDSKTYPEHFFKATALVMTEKTTGRRAKRGSVKAVQVVPINLLHHKGQWEGREPRAEKSQNLIARSAKLLAWEAKEQSAAGSRELL